MKISMNRSTGSNRAVRRLLLPLALAMSLSGLAACSKTDPASTDGAAVETTSAVESTDASPGTAAAASESSSATPAATEATGGESSGSSTATDTAVQTPNDPSTAPDGFIVKGTSGKDILLDRLWKRGCIPGTNGNDWTNASRTIVGHTLTFALIDYQNGSKTPNCENGRVGQATLAIEVTNDNLQVPITWVDGEGKPSTPPAGLEAVTTAVGATGTMRSATITPETQARANQLNAAKFCEATDWAPGVGKDGVACLSGGVNPFKATIVVDDSSLPWKVYDGGVTKFDENGYPTEIPNYLPHQGPFTIAAA